MAFSRTEEKKGISLPGLIDIIFLLLIFSLATFSFTDSSLEEEKGAEGTYDLELPEARVTETFKTDDVLQTLLFQIEHTDSEDPSSPKVVYVLWPSWEDSLDISQAKNNAQRDSLFAVFPDDFLRMSDRDFARTPACILMKWALQTYKNDHFREPNYANTIEIRAVRNTEFRIINFILEQCSAYGDTIPRFTLRTLSGQEVGSGF